MKKLSINLKHCFGIQYLDETFSFEKSNVQLIYAPNGVMKTSLAKTFQCVQQDKEEPRDILYNLPGEYSIQIDDEDIKPEEILVVKPFDADFEAKNLSTLLVNSNQKRVYDLIYKEIIDARNQLSKKLNKLSKISQEKVESQIIKDFEVDNIFAAIEAIQEFGEGNIELSKVIYAKVLDPKVIELLEDQKIKDNIQNYSDRYNELIEQSTLFSKGKFNPTNAATVSKALKKERFFEAEHKLLMRGKDAAVSDHSSFDHLLHKETESVLGDGELQEISKKIISGVAAIKTFQEVLEATPIISAYLTDIARFKKILWHSYYLTDQSNFDNLLELFSNKKSDLTAIEEQAKLENTLWHDVQDVFKRRFYVPYEVSIEDHRNVILGTVSPNMFFYFFGKDGKPIRFDRGQLDSLDCLSVGERRAMYLMYVIFELKARLESGQRSVIIIDDIADSFDYKNKYAIVEYLKELADEDIFRLIILTHNFDFYRTVQSRILGNNRWDNSHIAQKNSDKVKLFKGCSRDVANPFALWKDEYDSNPEALISMIPFIRNLIEYRDGNSSTIYKKLTSMLHIKNNVSEPDYKTREQRIGDLEDIISDVIPRKDLGANFNKSSLVIDLIYETATKIAEEKNVVISISLDKKIVLSIAIRLKAEEFMWANVSDKSPIRGSQTGKLYDRIVRERIEEPEFEPFLKLLGQVTLMTPENIHLNSFMYEPLIDMSIDHLVDLFNKVTNTLIID